jgi:hypothetical protein
LARKLERLQTIQKGRLTGPVEKGSTGRAKSSSSSSGDDDDDKDTLNGVEEMTNEKREESTIEHVRMFYRYN